MEEERQKEGIQGPSILIVVKGSGKIAWSTNTSSSSSKEEELKEGSVLFIKSGTPISLEASSGEEGLEVYRAFVEVDEEEDKKREEKKEEEEEEKKGSQMGGGW